MQLADAVWAATALLHQENPLSPDFGVQDIVSRAVDEGFVGGFRPGLQPHASWHCVANKKPAGGRHRMLFETTRGRRRLVRPGDNFHPDRNGRIRPEESDLPESFRSLIGWYDRVYTRQNGNGVTRTESGVRPSQERQNVATGTLIASESNQARGPVFLGASGQVEIPEALRAELGLIEGSCLSVYREADRIVLHPITDAYIRSLRGFLKPKKGETSLLDLWEREHRDEKY